MPLVSTGELVSAAQAEGRGIAAFNVITLEHAEAIAAGAERAGAPAILQISENAVKFHGGRLSAIAAAAATVARTSGAPSRSTSTMSSPWTCCTRRTRRASAR